MGFVVLYHVLLRMIPIIFGFHFLDPLSWSDLVYWEYLRSLSYLALLRSICWIRPRDLAL